MKHSHSLERFLSLAIIGLSLAGCEAAALTGPTPSPSPTASPRRETGVFEGMAALGSGAPVLIKSQYVVDLPAGYDPGSGVTYALEVYLHGGGETGIPFAAFENTVHRPQILVGNNDRFPLIILFPQLPDASLTWKQLTGLLNTLIDQVVAKYPIDANRIYLTGYSDGGYGALAMGAAYPERFAAIAEVSGYYDSNLDELCNLKNTPVLLYHNHPDQAGPLQAEKEVEEALISCKGKVTLIVLNGLDHLEIAGAVYNQPDIYARLFAHSLADQ